MRPAILLVTCCLEQSRYEILQQVISNIRTSCPPEWRDEITVFDNASTWVGVGELKSTFKNVCRSDRNVGYWTAIDWWLRELGENPPEYTYVIESDMIHYAAGMLGDCVRFLDNHTSIGAVRLHEYSVANFRLYDKDNPQPASRRGLWQSHTNKVTGEAITHSWVEGPFWRSNFLTQLPALNRYSAIRRAFDELRTRQGFTELDFQALYHAAYPHTAVLDGGIFNCDLNPYGSKAITGSWTPAQELQQLGYQPTRVARIAQSDEYTVTRV